MLERQPEVCARHGEPDCGQCWKWFSKPAQSTDAVPPPPVHFADELAAQPRTESVPAADCPPVAVPHPEAVAVTELARQFADAVEMANAAAKLIAATETALARLRKDLAASLAEKARIQHEIQKIIAADRDDEKEAHEATNELQSPQRD